MRLESMSTTTKNDLVKELSNRTGLTQAEAYDAFQHALHLIMEALAKGDEVSLRQFGSFEVRVTKPKIGRNPNKPGSEMVIPSRAVVRFTPGRRMNEQVASLIDLESRPNGRTPARA